MIRYKLSIYNSDTGVELEMHDSYTFDDLEIAHRRFLEKYENTNQHEKETE